MKLTLIALLTTAFINSVSIFGMERFEIQGPAGSQTFGELVTVLPNGNFVVVDSRASLPSVQGGAVYLYNGETKQLISRLHGSNSNDRVGIGGISVLPSGNFVVKSPNWNGQRGAITFCSKTIGCEGALSVSNSLVGNLTTDRLGLGEPIILLNGNYLVQTIGRGSVTLCSGNAPTVGHVSTENSLMGENPNDGIGASFITAHSNGGYSVESPSWNSGRGAVTFCDGAVGCRGVVSSSNSLVGQDPGNRVGDSPVYMESAVKEVGNGNFVVISSSWDHSGLTNAGAVTWLSSSTGLNGVVSPSNSLIGSVANMNLGRVTVLKNGNYVVLGSTGNTGSVTFGSGGTGVFGVVSESNSMVGSDTNNDLYLASVVPLTNGNYVVNAPSYKIAPTLDGIARFCNGTSGCTGRANEANSLVGVFNYGSTTPITPLVNGNYVVKTNYAATFGNGTSGVVGRITAENSLISPNHAGLGMRIVALPNGNYYVLNSSWDPPSALGGGARGAVTFGNGNTGTVGITSVANSLVNERDGDTTEFFVQMLPTGDLLLQNASWNDYRGALTFLSSTTAPIGVVNATNSLVGTNEYDYVGGNVNVLANGNYVVVAYNWNNVRGAVRLCKLSQPCIGEVNESNSLVGTNPNDRVGGGNNLTGIIEVNNSHFVVGSPNWNGDRGAATVVSSANGLIGHVGTGNSLVGSTTLDLISNGDSNVKGTIDVRDGLFLIYSPKFDTPERVDAGAITIGSVLNPLVGNINSGNSFIGPSTGAGTLSFQFDRVNRQLIVGRQLANAVSVLIPEYPVTGNVRITGLLRMPTGAPLRDVLIKLTREDGSVLWRRSRPNGVFEFENITPLRNYTLTFASKRYRFDTRNLPFVSSDLYLGDIFGSSW